MCMCIHVADIGQCSMSSSITLYFSINFILFHCALSTCMYVHISRSGLISLVSTLKVSYKKIELCMIR